MSENRRGVLDPQWEDELRAGQDADGGQGSVDAELAVVHLLRHAAGPEALDAEGVDAVWSDVATQIESESGFTPWWRRVLDWRVGVGVAVAVAAAAVLVLAPGDDTPPPGETSGPIASGPGAAGMSVTLQAQFDMLAPQARSAIDARVDEGRGAVRTQLLASLGSGADATLGGAP
ncbi:MAG: hypothetical protein ACE37F_10460 [Nannocystaceae bacterium]|nr:hypothetical protein [bacterium]